MQKVIPTVINQFWPPENLLKHTRTSDYSQASTMITAFTAILMVHLFARDFGRFLEYGNGVFFYLGLGFFCCFLGSMVKSLQRPSIFIAFFLATFKFSYNFPRHSNHFFIEWFCLLLLTLAFSAGHNDKQRDQSLLESLRWIVVIIMVGSGIQKILHGTYFTGTFLAWMVSTDVRFLEAFSLIAPDDVARLVAAKGTGPYIFESPLAIAISNLVYIGEIIPGVLLLFPRYRALGLAGYVMMLIAIEVIAMELLFMFLCVNLLLLFSTKAWNRTLLPVFIGLYLLLILMRFGIVQLLTFFN